MSKTVGFIGGKFLPLHQGHVYVILEASNQVDELYVILSSSENRDLELCKRDGIKYISAEKRMTWLGNIFTDIENIHIINVVDDHWDADYDWKEGASLIKKAIGKPIDVVFSSEESYAQHFDKHYPESTHVVIDDVRKTVPISATELRKNLYAHWDMLPRIVQKDFTKKIVVVGTESVGKSTLVKKLAKFFNTNYVHEVGRTYCDENSNQLTANMFNHIAMDHFMLQEKKLLQSNRMLFVDSEAIITQYYLDMYYPGQHSVFIDELAKLQNYDLVLYLEPDVNWVDDGIRFAGKTSLRQKNNNKLKQMFDARGISYVSISGNYQKRFDISRKLVKNLFKEGKNE